MAGSIQVRIYCEDDSDMDWLYPRVEGNILDIIEENKDRYDGDVTMEIDKEWID